MGLSVAALEQLVHRLKLTDGKGLDSEDALAAALMDKNRQNTWRYMSTPYSERMVCLPHCMRSTARCQAEERGGEYFCKGCGACKIAEIAGYARDLGYLSARILKGGSVLMRVVRETGPRAVLGICCGVEGVMGIMACESEGIPAFCVSLTRAGCADTDVDLQDVRAAMEAVVS